MRNKQDSTSLLIEQKRSWWRGGEMGKERREAEIGVKEEEHISGEQMWEPEREREEQKRDRERDRQN